MQNQFFRFLIVGVLNTIFGYGLFAILLLVNVHYSIALVLSTVLGVLFNFKTTGLLVFSSNDEKKIFKFVLVYLFVYLINVGGIALLENNGLNPLFGGAAMLIPCSLLAFALQKKLVFAHE